MLDARGSKSSFEDNIIILQFFSNQILFLQIVKITHYFLKSLQEYYRSLDLRSDKRLYFRSIEFFKFQIYLIHVFCPILLKEIAIKICYFHMKKSIKLIKIFYRFFM